MEVFVVELPFSVLFEQALIVWANATDSKRSASLNIPQLVANINAVLGSLCRNTIQFVQEFCPALIVTVTCIIDVLGIVSGSLTLRARAFVTGDEFGLH